MIRLKRVSKSFRYKGAYKPILSEVSIALIGGESIALLGRNGAGKSTLLRLLSGILAPDAGSIETGARVSWPVAFSGGLHGDMTGAQNARFVARVYRRDTDDMVRFCREMSELGDVLNMPVRSYSSGMRARLAFSMSMAVPFDYYLIDEITSVGDLAFREKSEAILAARLGVTGGVVVSHALGSLRRLCTSGMVLENGKLLHFDNIEEAIKRHQGLMTTS